MLQTPKLSLIEPVPIDDDLCTGLATIEPVGLGVRLVFFAEQTLYESNTSAAVIKRKIVLPTDALEELGAIALRHLANRASD